MKWIEKNWKAILIGLNIPIALTFGVLFWKTFDNNEINSLSNFSDFTTPVISLISAVGVLVTLYYLSKQNKFLLGQILKPHYDKQFDGIEVMMNSEVFFEDRYVDNLGFGLDVRRTKVKNIMEFFRIEMLDRLQDNFDYIHDVDIKESFDVSYFKDRSYYRYIFFLQVYYFNGIKEIDSVISFAKSINDSELVESDKKLYRARVKSELVFNFIVEYETLKYSGGFKIPVIWKPKNTKFVEFTSSAIRLQYEELQNALNPKL